MHIIGRMDYERDANKNEDKKNNRDYLSISGYSIIPILLYQANLPV
jgi:hypothetical protein